MDEVIWFMGEFERRIKENIPLCTSEELENYPYPSLIYADVLKIVDDVRKEIFPLPKGDILINPITGERDAIRFDLKDWLPFIQKLRRWFDEEKVININCINPDDNLISVDDDFNIIKKETQRNESYGKTAKRTL